MVPRKEGLIPKERLGIAIEIKSDRQELVNEVKRIGYMKDRECGL